jgi:hypothetical protein
MEPEDDHLRTHRRENLKLDHYRVQNGPQIWVPENIS